MALKQVAALPYRLDADGRLDVMLVTSRGSRRWIPPKGNLIPGLSLHEVAAQEAYEEAGVIGRVSATPLGEYTARKTNARRGAEDLLITVFPLAYTRQERDWPEKGQRLIIWCSIDQASGLVIEAGLSMLIKNLHRSDLFIK